MEYDDVDIAIKQQAQDYLDQSRGDLMAREGAEKVMRFILEEQIPDKPHFKDFPITTSKMPGSSFVDAGNEYEIIMYDHEITSLIYGMGKPRSEKTVHETILANELRLMLKLNLNRSRGASGNRTNLLTSFSSIFRHTVHSFTDDGQNPGMGGRIKGFLRGL